MWRQAVQNQLTICSRKITTCGKITAMLHAEKVSIPNFNMETFLQQLQQLTEGDLHRTHK